MADTFRCTLVTPERQVLDEDVVYASIPAWDGLIGLAAQRAPLMAKLGDGPLRLDLPQGGSKWYFIGGGFAQMKDNKLSLVANEAIAAEDLVEQKVTAALREAEGRKAVTDKEVAKRDRDQTRGRVMLALLEHAAAKA